MMKRSSTAVLLASYLLAACAFIQEPAEVSDSAAPVVVTQSGDQATVGPEQAPAPVESTASAPALPPVRQTPAPVPTTPAAPATAPKPAAPARLTATATPEPAAERVALERLPEIAKLRQKNPAGLKRYVGQVLYGRAKFVKAAAKNPNAAVADASVKGVGEVSLWCKNIATGTLTKNTVAFEGTLTGAVYTSEDFSHDVYLKDCRLRN